MQTYTPLRPFVQIARYAGVPLLVIGVTVSLGFLFHLRGQQIVEQQLRERMLSTVSIAALQIDPVSVQRVRTEKDMQTTAFKTLVEQLQTIRSLSPHARFVYIMRRTDDPDTLSFVADADALLTDAELDVDGSGVVEEDEVAGLPGDPYPLEGVPALRDEAFDHPVVDSEITVDQWGRLISAYAPIKNDQGETVAVLGIDMEADEFFRMTESTFSMVAVALVALVGTLLAAYILLIIRSRHEETLRQLDTERTALLDLATHQLGMPLATFRWWLELLKERDNGKFCKRGDVCDQLQEGIDRMDSIIKSLQQAGRLQENSFSTDDDRSVLPTVTKQVIGELQKNLTLRKQKVHTSFKRGLPAVHLDGKLCAGLIRELIENASWYSPQNTDIDVSATALHNGVELRVSDHGHGIPKEDLPHIFEQFKRGSNATKYKPAGNGLGLYIVRRIVERARGKISIESQLEHGTTVIVFLPAV